jgi:polar amino acid transport system substrate-binding protein
MARGIIVLCACLALAGCGAKTGAGQQSASDLLSVVKQRGTLVVSTDGNYSPQSFLRADGTWVGFDVDVARELSRRLGVKPEFVDSNFDAVTAGNWNGRWDVNVDSMSVTTARKQNLLFTAPYYFVPATFVVRRDSRVAVPSQLAGARVGVGTATTYQAYLNHSLAGDIEPILVNAPPRASAVAFETDALALQELAIGGGKRIDAVLTAEPTAAAAIRAGLPLRIITSPIFYEDDAVALDKHSASAPEPLLSAVDDALSGMLRDGTISRLSKRYYGADLTRKH